MGSKISKNKRNSISALEDNSTQTKVNTELNAKIGAIIDDLVRQDDRRSVELTIKEKENISFPISADNSDDGKQLVNEFGSDQIDRKKINYRSILVNVNNESSIKCLHSFRVKRLQKRSESETKNLDLESEIVFKKSKRKGVRFSDDVIIINDNESELENSKQKNSPPKTEYIRLVSVSNFEANHLKPKYLMHRT